MVKRRGFFVVIEGTDGSGKSSVIEELKARFAEALFTREPGGTPFAEALRGVMFEAPGAQDADGLTHLLLHYAARRDHLLKCIAPALAEGSLVVCDRFAASSWAYNVRGQECAACEGVFAPLHQSVVGQYEPDAYIWLDIPPEAAHERRRAAGAQNHFDTRDAAFQKRVYEAYTEYFTEHFSGHLVRIDATQPLERCSERSRRVDFARVGAAEKMSRK
ncbi:MAG: thymidylate kinase [Candidatus Parcubacteria bacterium]|nr:MAG: thymidylate kinase [Candidatus Parcubacteria bacterium]